MNVDFEEFDNIQKSSKLLQRRHYKKDSRFVFDLYTLCYDENESVDTVELFTSIVQNTAAENWCAKRRSDREEIRRRLAMGAEETSNALYEGPIRKPNIQSALQSSLYFGGVNEFNSDNESHSSDSETCPKLSKIRQNNNAIASVNATVTTPTTTPLTTNTTISNSYRVKPLSVSCTNSNNNNHSVNNKQQYNNTNNNKSQYQLKQQEQQQQQQQQCLLVTDEDRECEFFTKQARLQIEARMALAQAKDMAHMQMEIERQNRATSPITAIIRGALEKIGIRMTVEKRRVSRQMLTDMNIAQLQILVNSLHTHIEELNEALVKHLMERDDLHVGQDSMLVDIEEVTRYIGTKEHLTHQHKKSTIYRNKN